MRFYDRLRKRKPNPLRVLRIPAAVKPLKDIVQILVGVDYEPLIVATQTVAGTNYKFICNAEAVVLNPCPYLAEIAIFQPLPQAEETKPVIFLKERTINFAILQMIKVLVIVEDIKRQHSKILFQPKITGK